MLSIDNYNIQTMTIVLGIFGSLLSRFFPSTNQQLNVNESRAADSEVWTIVTEGGRYPEVWETYRDRGLLEAIKERDDKAAFDRRLAHISSPVSAGNLENIQQGQTIDRVTTTPRQTDTLTPHSSDRLDELELANIRNLAAYFEDMSGKIILYHQDHRASKEEAKIICKYYQQTAELLDRVQTKAHLSQAIEAIEKLNKKVSRYQHEHHKYRWSTGLEKMLIELRKTE